MPVKELKEKVKEIQLVVFRLCDQEFALEVSTVLEASRMLEITRIPEAPGYIEGVVNLRGDVIAVADLAKQFGLERRGGYSKSARIVVVQAGPETVGLIVDEVPEVIRIPEENIQATPELIQTKLKQEYVRGVAKLGERLIVVLNLNSLSLK